MGFGIAIESEVGSEPGGVDKIAEARKIFQKIRSEESGRGKNDELGLKLGFAGENAGAAAVLRDAVHHLAGADVSADELEEAARDPAVAFGPGERAFFLGFAGRKKMNAGPGGRVARPRPLLAPPRVIHFPLQPAG